MANARRASATIEELAEHASSLASAFGIVVINDVTMLDSHAITSTPNNPHKVAHVHIASVTTEAAYATALHEYGHSQAAWGLLRTSIPSTGIVQHMRVRLEEERAAWEWAEYYALVWTDEMRRTRVIAQGSYERQLGAAQIATNTPSITQPTDRVRAAHEKRTRGVSSIATLAQRLKRSRS
jgi:hypothetical protein